MEWRRYVGVVQGGRSRPRLLTVVVGGGEGEFRGLILVPAMERWGGGGTREMTRWR
jgi:hypothetical protein